MSFLIRWIVGVIAVCATVHVGRIIGVGLEWRGWPRALLFVVVLAIVNAVIRPIVKVLTLPLNCLTFGLFAFVVNALLFWGTAYFTKGIEVQTFWAALFGSVVLGFLSAIINALIRHPSTPRET